MKRAIFGVLVLAAVFVCVTGPAPAQVPVKPDWKEGFRAHDKNGDGRIDRAEFQDWMVDVFYHRDTGHKGYLVFDDVKDVMSAEKFKARDRNGDGKVTLQEFLNATFQDFAAADVSHSGSFTMQEFEDYIKRSGK